MGSGRLSIHFFYTCYKSKVNKCSLAITFKIQPFKTLFFILPYRLFASKQLHVVTYLQPTICHIPNHEELGYNLLLGNCSALTQVFELIRYISYFKINDAYLMILFRPYQTSNVITVLNGFLIHQFSKTFKFVAAIYNLSFSPLICLNS